MALLAVVFALFGDVKNLDTPVATPPPSVVDALTEAQKQSVREFVKNFILLYNSYAYGDYSNLSSLGDYQTQKAQKQTLDRIEQLLENTPVGFRRIVEVSNSGIEVKSLLFPPKQIETKIKFWVKDQVIIPEGTTPRSDDAVKPKEYEARATLRLVPYNQSWLVDNIILSD